MATEAAKSARQSPGAAALDEEGLLCAARDGDKAAFADLVEAYWARLFRWLHHLSHDRHLSEDLAQEAFLRAYANLGKFRPGTNFRAWLFRIAHNAFANHERAAKRRRGPPPDDLPGRDPGPLDQAMAREALAGLEREVRRLPEDLRSAFVLRAEEGLSFREIAAVLDLTEETARWRVFKARQRLLSRLAPESEKS